MSNLARAINQLLNWILLYTHYTWIVWLNAISALTKESQDLVALPLISKTTADNRGWQRSPGYRIKHKDHIQGVPTCCT